MSGSNSYVTLPRLRGTAYAMITITSIFVLVRFVLRWNNGRRYQAEDLLVFLSYCFFLTMTILYLVAIPFVYRSAAIQAGLEQPYPEMMDDALRVTKIFFVNSMMLFITLWTVKASLLALYRRLMSGIKKYMIWWWVVTGFCIVSIIGAIISNFTSCSSMKAWFTVGACSTPRDVRAQIASLYYAFAVDVISDVMIMVLPLGLIWSLQMPLNQKLSIGGVFCIGLICIITAIIRVVQLGVEQGQTQKSPAPTWLIFWAIVECAIAVIIGCLPAFAVFYRTAVNSRHGYSDRYGYGGNYQRGPSKFSEQRHGAVKLSNLSSNTRGDVQSHATWTEPSASEEHIVKSGEIFVTSSIQVENETASGRNVGSAK